MLSERVSLSSGVELSTTTFSPPGTPTECDVLLTHGLASNQRLWFGAAEALAARGHRVVTFDQRGHGQSSKPDHGYDMATVADDLVLLIEALGLQQPVIGGQSWGGNVVLEASHRHGDTIAGAVLVDGGFLHLRRQFPAWEDCAAALAPPPLLGTPLSEITRWVESNAADWPEAGRQATLANFEARPDGTIAPWLTFDRHMTVLRGLWEHEPAAIYPEITPPVLIIAAVDSPENRSRKAPGVAEAVDAIASASVRWFDPAHHDVHAQHPTAVAEAVHEFTRSLSHRD